jgi:DNA relaxase NicK
MAFTAKQPTILIRVPENREKVKAAVAENVKRGVKQHSYMTSEVLKQELKKVAIDYSAQKIRGSYRYISRVYDIVTDELLEETERNIVSPIGFSILTKFTLRKSNGYETFKV